MNRRFNNRWPGWPSGSFLFTACLFCYSSGSQAWEVSCPSFVDIKASTSILASSVDVAWQTSSRYPPRLWLDGVGMSQGKPENRLDLKPELEKTKEGAKLKWDTTLTENQGHGRYWVSCVYNRGQVWLSQPVPAAAMECSTAVLSRQLKPGDRPVLVQCH